MRQLNQTFKVATAALLILVLATCGIGFARAQATAKPVAPHSIPVWHEINRQIVLNPDNPAPPDVVAQLVSLEVTYKGFDGHDHRGIVEVNRALEDDVLTFFRWAYYLNFQIKEVAVSSDPRFGWDDNKLMDANITSCFNYRTIAGTNTPSQHGIGRACDINARTNPYLTLDDHGNPVTQPTGAYWKPGHKGALFDAHPLIQLMKSRCWTWGGDWTLEDTDGAVTDYQHLQKKATATCPTPARASTSTNAAAQSPQAALDRKEG